MRNTRVRKYTHEHIYMHACKHTYLKHDYDILTLTGILGEIRMAADKRILSVHVSLHAVAAVLSLTSSVNTFVRRRFLSRANSVFFCFFFSRVPILYTSDLYVVSLISTVIPCATRPHLGRKRVRLKHSGPQLPQLNANSVRELTESTIFREDSAWQGSSVRCPIYSGSAFIHVAD